MFSVFLFNITAMLNLARGIRDGAFIFFCYPYIEEEKGWNWQTKEPPLLVGSVLVLFCFYSILPVLFWLACASDASARLLYSLYKSPEESEIRVDKSTARRVHYTALASSFFCYLFFFFFNSLYLRIYGKEKAKNLPLFYSEKNK